MNRLGIFLSETAETVQSGAQGQSLDGMVDMLDTLLVVMMIAVGIYAIYSAIRLYREQMLFPNKFLYPGDCKPEDCLDPGCFIDYIFPRLLILGAALLIMGILLGLNSYLFKIDALWIDISMMVVPVSIFVWYMLCQRKAAKSFW